MNDLWTKLHAVFRDVFDDDALTVTAQTTARDVPGWDSLNHVNLIVAVEKAFGIKLTTREATTLANVGELATLVEKKLTRA
ncbi:MAG TPA: acyl carrier protein [Labilithrix sp.]|jgi:acyl carrier protein